MLSFILLGIGLLMIFLEFYLPHGVMGVIGALTLLCSIVLFAADFHSPLLIILYVAAVAVLLYYLFLFALWRIKSAPPERSVYLQSDQEGYVASEFDKSAIGKIGVVDSDLKPGGHIRIEGKRHLAISLSGYISRGEEVLVVGGEGESLTVKHYIRGKTS